MFPLGTVLLPHAPIALHVFEDRYRALVRHCLAGDGSFGVVLISRGSEVGGGDQRVALGTVARIEIAQALEDGRWGLVARGTCRIRVRSWVADNPYPRALVEEIDEGPWDPDHEALALARAEVTRARVLLSEMGEDTNADASDVEDQPDVELWRLCAQAPLAVVDHQRLLEADHHGARLDLLRRLCGELTDDLARYFGGAG